MSCLYGWSWDFGGLFKFPLESILVENDHPHTRLTQGSGIQHYEMLYFQWCWVQQGCKDFSYCVNYISGVLVTTADLLGKNRGLDVVFKLISPHTTKHLRTVKWVSNFMWVCHWRMLILLQLEGNNSSCVLGRLVITLLTHSYISQNN